MCPNCSRGLIGNTGVVCDVCEGTGIARIAKNSTNGEVKLSEPVETSPKKVEVTKPKKK